MSTLVVNRNQAKRFYEMDNKIDYDSILTKLHSVDTGISYAVGLKRIKNDIEFPIYILESTRIITISL